MPEVSTKAIWKPVSARIPCFLSTILVGALVTVYVIWGQVVTGGPEDEPVVSVIGFWESLEDYRFYILHNTSCQEDFDVHCNSTFWGPHRLAVIVPFQGSREDVIQFSTHLHYFLQLVRVRHKFFFINQVDGFRYNKGALFNIGVTLSQGECDYVSLQDIDMLPDDTNLPFKHPGQLAMYIAAPHSNPNNYKDYYMGGIYIMSTKQYKEVNGFSNNFWGINGADDNFKYRLQHYGIKLEVRKVWGPVWNDWTLPFKQFDHLHDLNAQLELVPLNTTQFQNETYSGMSDLSFNIKNITEVLTSHPDQEDSASSIILDVSLNCSHTDTQLCAKYNLTTSVIPETTSASLS